MTEMQIKMAQQFIYDAGLPITVLNEDTVTAPVDGEQEIFLRDDTYGGHPLSGLATFGNISGDHRMIRRIAEDVEQAFTLIDKAL